MDESGNVLGTYDRTPLTGIFPQHAMITDLGVDSSMNDYTIECSKDGSIVAVGIPYHDYNYTVITSTNYNQGAIHIYHYENNNWVKRFQNIFRYSNNDRYGSSLAMSDDGTRLVVGSNVNSATSAGFVSCFEYETGDIIGAKKIQLRLENWNGGVNILNVAEVEVYATDGTNVANSANGGSASLSSVYTDGLGSSFPASNAIDNSYNNYAHTNTTDFTHTLEISFGTSYNISYVRIHNRLGNDQLVDRLEGCEIRLLDVNDVPLRTFYYYESTRNKNNFYIDFRAGWKNVRTQYNVISAKDNYLINGETGRFGKSVAITGDGSVVSVSAPDLILPKIYFFKWSDIGSYGNTADMASSMPRYILATGETGYTSIYGGSNIIVGNRTDPSSQIHVDMFQIDGSFPSATVSRTKTFSIGGGGDNWDNSGNRTISVSHTTDTDGSVSHTADTTGYFYVLATTNTGVYHDRFQMDGVSINRISSQKIPNINNIQCLSMDHAGTFIALRDSSVGNNYFFDYYGTSYNPVQVDLIVGENGKYCSFTKTSGDGLDIFTLGTFSASDTNITLSHKKLKSPQSPFAITHEGNVGIGTTSPTARCQIFGNSGLTISPIELSGTRTAVLRLGAQVAEDRDYYCAKITSTNNHAQNYWSDLRFYTYGGNANYGDPIEERMCITPSGNVGIGTTSPSYNLDLTYAGEILTGKIHLFNDQQTIAATTNTLALFGKNANGGIGFYTTDTTTFSDAKMYIINNGNVGIGTTSPSATLDVSGSVKATSFNATSDYRVKENVQTISGGIYTVDNLRPVSYVLKESQEPHVGFIAHELQEHIPTAVRGEKDGETMQSVNYSELIPILVKEIQDLKQEVHSLKQQVQDLSP